MRRGLLGLLLFGATPALAHPKVLMMRMPVSKKPEVRPAFDRRLPSMTKLLRSDWSVPAWAANLPARPPQLAKRRITVTHASMSGGNGVKVKIPW